eukprot:scaffold677956_cov73-Prasinocladus_malaysianus.AAC.1
MQHPSICFKRAPTGSLGGFRSQLRAPTLACMKQRHCDSNEPTTYRQDGASLHRHISSASAEVGVRIRVKLRAREKA